MSNWETVTEILLQEGNVVPLPARDAVTHVPHPPQAIPNCQLAIISSIYHQDFVHYRQTGRVRISFADTYQGRVSGSTNGCSVIAPLFCIHHLLESQFPDPGLPDSTIKQVIDHETPVVLKQLRRRLGLSGQAFLTPSDVHDFFIENGQLGQGQFINVLGGSILNDMHLSAFLDSLEEPSISKRQVAATLFFREHVVGILKLHRADGVCWYDLLDSLPLKKTFARHKEDEINLQGGRVDFRSGALLPMTARIRCLDASALKVFLRWYACSKFGEDDMSYIDTYEWDDKSNCDPRVFQAFLWADDA